MTTVSQSPRSAGRIAWLVFAAVIGTLVALVLVLNLVGRMAFSAFYDNARIEMAIPGTDAGFVVQDQAQLPDGSWLFSGYEGNGGASPLYRVSPQGEATRLTVARPDGSTYDGHGGGVTCDQEYVYLTDENGYLVLPLGEVQSAQAGQEVLSTSLRQLGIDPAFLTIMDGRLYAGVFYREGPYDTPAVMHLTAPDGTQNHAVMYAYEPTEQSQPGNYGEQPVCVYSIPDQVQGVAVVDDLMVFSQSWGLSPSQLPAYRLSQLVQQGTYEVNGREVPLVYIDGDSWVGTVTAPPMSEGLVTKDGRVWLSNESASNKYFFGKLFGSWYVMGLDVSAALGL